MSKPLRRRRRRLLPRLQRSLVMLARINQRHHLADDARWPNYAHCLPSLASRSRTSCGGAVSWVPLARQSPPRRRHHRHPQTVRTRSIFGPLTKREVRPSNNSALTFASPGRARIAAGPCLPTRSTLRDTSKDVPLTRARNLKQTSSQEEKHRLLRSHDGLSSALFARKRIFLRLLRFSVIALCMFVKPHRLNGKYLCFSVERVRVFQNVSVTLAVSAISNVVSPTRNRSPDTAHFFAS